MNISILKNKIQNIELKPEAHSIMLPSYRGPISSTSEVKESAVAIILFERENEIFCIYTKRTEHPLDKHSGQISFPGGKKDTNDINLIETACRETFEEIGLQLSKSLCIKELSPIQIPVSNFIVHPFIFVLPETPTSYNPEVAEVAEILEIPYSHLLQKSNTKTKTIIQNNTSISIPYYSWKNHEIWGATAMISAEFLAMAKQ